MKKIIKDKNWKKVNFGFEINITRLYIHVKKMDMPYRV